jgi:large subunit ribosomal protein L18
MQYLKSVEDRKKNRVKKKITAGNVRKRPVMMASITNKHIAVQIVEKGYTVVSASTLEAEVKKKVQSTSGRQAARYIGKKIARRALEKNVTQCVFDRGSRDFHGKIRELADSARSHGLKI